MTDVESGGLCEWLLEREEDIDYGTYHPDSDVDNFFSTDLTNLTTFDPDEQTKLIECFNQAHKFQVRVTVEKVGLPNHIDQNFPADFRLDILVPRTKFENSISTLQNSWYIVNMESEKAPQVTGVTLQLLQPACDDNCPELNGAIAYFCFSISIKGTFEEPFELQDYPFDSQDLKIILGSTIPINVDDFEPNKDLGHTFIRHQTKTSVVVKSTFRFADVWELCPHISMKSTVSTEGQEMVYPRLHIILKAYRLPASTIVNTVLPIFAMSYLSMGVFFIPRSDNPAPRFGASLSILFVQVGYKVSTSSKLPEISYLTAIDKFLFFHFVFQVIIAFFHAMAHFIVPVVYDRHVLIILYGIFLTIVNAWFFIGWFARYMDNVYHFENLETYAQEEKNRLDNLKENAVEKTISLNQPPNARKQPSNN